MSLRIGIISSVPLFGKEDRYRHFGKTASVIGRQSRALRPARIGALFMRGRRWAAKEVVMLNMGLFSDSTLLAWIGDLYRVFNQEEREHDVRMDAYERLLSAVTEARIRGLEVPSFAVGLGE